MASLKPVSILVASRRVVSSGWDVKAGRKLAKCFLNNTRKETKSTQNMHYIYWVTQY